MRVKESTASLAFLANINDVPHTEASALCICHSADFSEVLQVFHLEHYRLGYGFAEWNVTLLRSFVSRLDKGVGGVLKRMSGYAVVMVFRMYSARLELKYRIMMWRKGITHALFGGNKSNRVG